MNLSNKNELIEYLKSHGLWAKKTFGQNFLVDEEALDKIVEAADLKPDDVVIEVGPGAGTLTERLVGKVKKVIAVELDRELAELLVNKFSNINYQVSSNDQLNNSSINKLNDHWNLKLDHSELEIVQNDILQLNIPDLVGDKPYKVVANIPYYITSKIINAFLTTQNKPESIVLLVQKEVAERICAKPGDLSILSLSVQIFGSPEITSIVKANSFFPAPKVDSAILRISKIHDWDLAVPESDLFRLIKVCFASKRKTLLNNLSAGFQLDKPTIESIIEKTGLNLKARAQDLSLDNWVKLCQEFNLKK